MARLFLNLTIILTFIFCSNIVSSQEAGEVVVSTDETEISISEETAAPAEEPTVSAVEPEVSVEPAAAPQVESERPAAPAENETKEEIIVLIDDALPKGAITDGTWEWDNALKFSAEKSHTEPSAKAFTEHSYKTDPIEIPKNSVVEQYVYLDPNDVPKGIMLKFKFEINGKEGQIGIYREGEEEVFLFDNDEPMLYYGTLPDAGRWVMLQIYTDDLGLGDAKLIGLSFTTYGGKANWDLTTIRPMREGEQSP